MTGLGRGGVLSDRKVLFKQRGNVGSGRVFALDSHKGSLPCKQR